MTRSPERNTTYLRKRSLNPTEQSTEEQMPFVIDQLVARSPEPVPEAGAAEASSVSVRR